MDYNLAFIGFLLAYTIGFVTGYYAWKSTMEPYEKKGPRDTFNAMKRRRDNAAKIKKQNERAKGSK